MKIAIDEALLAQERFDEVPIGAVLVQNNTVIARAGNRTRTHKDPTAHAEILVLREAAQKIGNYRLTDCDLYVTLEPCTMCAGAISHARIKTLHFAATDPKGGAVSSGVTFFDRPTCHHAPQICQGGPYAEKCADMLSSFFRHKRAKRP